MRYIQLAHEWQDLIGAFLGSSLAIIFSGLGFLIARFINRVDERKEALRRIEISNTYSIQTAYGMQKKLLFFVERARNLASRIHSRVNSNGISLETTNFPALGTIHINVEHHNSRIKSYYLHNKLLVMHANTSDMNLIFTQFKEDFASVIRTNETLIGLTSNNPDPRALSHGYADNIDAFATEVNRYATEEIPKAINTMLQIRVYNGKLRKTFGRGLLTRWLYEGLKSSGRNLDLIDRIDASIENEVATMREKAESRARRS